MGRQARISREPREPNGEAGPKWTKNFADQVPSKCFCRHSRASTFGQNFLFRGRMTSFLLKASRAREVRTTKSKVGTLKHRDEFPYHHHLFGFGGVDFDWLVVRVQRKELDALVGPGIFGNGFFRGVFLYGEASAGFGDAEGAELDEDDFAFAGTTSIED